MTGAAGWFILNAEDEKARRPKVGQLREEEYRGNRPRLVNAARVSGRGWFLLVTGRRSLRIEYDDGKYTVGIPNIREIKPTGLSDYREKR